MVKEIDGCKNNLEKLSTTRVSVDILCLRYFERNKMILLTNEQHKSYEMAKICYISKKNFEDKYINKKNTMELEIIVIIKVNTEVLHIAYVV